MPKIVEAPRAKSPDVSPAYWLVGELEDVKSFNIGLTHLAFAAMKRRTLGRQKFRDMVGQVMRRDAITRKHALLFETLLSQRPEAVEELMNERRRALTKACARNHWAPDALQSQINQTDEVEPMLGDAVLLTTSGIVGSFAQRGGITPNYYRLEDVGAPDDLPRLPAGVTTVINRYGVEWASPDYPPAVHPNLNKVYGKIETGIFVPMYANGQIITPET